MGRDKTAYWEARRRSRDQQRSTGPRLYAFDARVVICGEAGPACLEVIERPLAGCPRATVRIIVRWAGKLPRGARVSTGSAELEVLRMFSMTSRNRVAHLLCRPAEAVKEQR